MFWFFEIQILNQCVNQKWALHHFAGYNQSGYVSYKIFVWSLDYCICSITVNLVVGQLVGYLVVEAN